MRGRQQALAMLDTTTGKVVKMTLKHEGNNVRELHSKLPRPVRVGTEATGSMQCSFEPHGRTGNRLPSRSSSIDSGLRAAEAET